MGFRIKAGDKKSKAKRSLRIQTIMKIAGEEPVTLPRHTQGSGMREGCHRKTTNSRKDSTGYKTKDRFLGLESYTRI